MFDLKISGKDVFKLSSAHYIPDTEGKKRICVVYKTHRGPSDALEISFEGYAKNDSVKVKEEYTFASLMKMFEDRRIYFSGVEFLDRQFEK